MNVLDQAKAVFDCEINALSGMKGCLGKSFETLVNAVAACTGRIVITGMGKSGHICRKIAATMQSLGIKAYFMHSAEGLHGDLGILTAEDIVIALSNSGETDEVLSLIPAIQQIGAKLFCIVGRENSTLQKLSSDAIIMPPMNEVFLGNLVPTSSTTVMLVLGDALSVAVAKKKGFTAADFGVFHPNGLLGKRLTLKVGSLMLCDDENSVIPYSSTVGQAIFEMCRKPIGGVNIVDEKGRLLGIFTDGDLRRLYYRQPEGAMNLKIDTVMTCEPMAISSGMLVSDVIREMEKKGKMVSFFPVVDDGILVGSLRLLDISKSGLLG